MSSTAAPPVIGKPLLQRDLEQLARSGISRATAEQALLTRVDSFTGGEMMGRNSSGNYAGILFPYIWPGDQHIREYRLRRDEPEVENGKLKNKYLSPPGCRNMLYLTPGTALEWLHDSSFPILITEGEKKCLALWELGWHGPEDAADRPPWLTIAISGVQNWQGKIGQVDGPRGERLDETGPIADLDRVAWGGRQVTIVFDANVHSNNNVRIARLSLAKNLRGRGAQVFFIDVPVDAGVNGIDDLIGTWGKDRVLGFLRQANYDPQESHKERQTPGQNWPEPLAVDALYGLAGKIVRTIEPHSESDLAALLIQFLVAFGNLIGRRAHFKAEADHHFTNLFTVIVGLTSKGRKGSSLGQVQFFLRGADSAWSLQRAQSGLSTGEGLIWKVRDPVYQSVPIKDKGRITGCETAMVDVGEKDKRLLITEPEFARVLQAAERKENTLSAVLRQCWDTGNLNILTRSQAACATHAHISLIGHITKDELRRLLTDTAKANGFCNRFLWVCAKRSKLLPEGGELHTVDLAPLTRKLDEAAKFSREVGEMQRDDAARSLWAKVYPELSEGKPGLFGAVTSRAESITMRLACLYALLDRSTTVRLQHLEAGLAVWRYCEASARFIFGEAIGDETADEILRALKLSPQGMTRTDLRDHFQRNKSAHEINRALGTLQELGLARMDKSLHGEAVRFTETWFAS